MIKAWFVLSACWVGFWSWYYDVPSCGSSPSGRGRNHGMALQWARSRKQAQYELVPLVIVAAVIIGVPVAVLLTGVAIRLLAVQDRRSNQDRHSNTE